MAGKNSNACALSQSHFSEGADTGSVDHNIRATAIRYDKAVPLNGIVPFDLA
jgi:hypothetical protein